MKSMYTQFRIFLSYASIRERLSVLWPETSSKNKGKSNALSTHLYCNTFQRLKFWHIRINCWRPGGHFNLAYSWSVYSCGPYIPWRLNRRPRVVSYLDKFVVIGAQEVVIGDEKFVMTIPGFNISLSWPEPYFQRLWTATIWLPRCN